MVVENSWWRKQLVRKKLLGETVAGGNDCWKKQLLGKRVVSRAVGSMKK
jgi:hypothetical protein